MFDTLNVPAAALFAAATLLCTAGGTAAEPQALVQMLRGHSDDVQTVRFTAEDEYVLSGSADQTLRQWRVSDGVEVRRIEQIGTVRATADLTDGRLIAAFAAHGELGAARCQMRTATVEESRVVDVPTYQGMALSDDCRHIAIGGHDGRIDVFSLPSLDRMRVLHGHETEVVALRFLLGGAIASAEYRGKVLFWEPSGRKSRELSLAEGMLETMDVSLDGSRIAAGRSDGVIEIWDAQAGKKQCELRGHTLIVNCLCFSHDGRRLLSGGHDRTARLWDLDQQIEIGRLRHDGQVTCVAFADKKPLVASGGHDRVIRVWKAP